MHPNSKQDELAAYMAVAGNHRILTHDEERSLAHRWREEGDREAAETLVRCNLRAVVKIASEFRAHYQGSISDLVQEGNIGLLKAVDRYDPDHGTRFLSYAGWWIRACIKEFLLRQRSLVRMGTTQRQRVVFSRLGRAKRELTARGDGELRGADRESALAEILGVPVSVLREMEGRLSGHDVSLNAEVGDDGDTTMIDLLADPRPDHAQVVEDHDLDDVRSDAILKALATLHPKERTIVQRRFFQDRSDTLKVIGADLGISRERVRQLEARALRKIGRALEEMGWNAGDLLEIPGESLVS